MTASVHEVEMRSRYPVCPSPLRALLWLSVCRFAYDHAKEMGWAEQ